MVHEEHQSFPGGNYYDCMGWDQTPPGREESLGPNGFFRFGPVPNDFCGGYVFDLGIHGGRGDYRHPTYGCIRTTDWFMEWLLFWDFFDPIEGLFVI